MAKVKLGLRDLSRDEKVDLANTIKTAMTGNANFTTPNPTLAAYGTLITTAQDCLPWHLVLPGNPSGVTCLWYVPGTSVTGSPWHIGYKRCMPWKETCKMSERMKLISDYLSGEYGISELAEQYEVSRKTIYKWIERHEDGGWEALRDQSRAPKHHPNAVSKETEYQLLELKARKPLWGAPKLRSKLLETVGPERCPVESTVSAILRRHGLSRIAKRRRRAVPSEQPLGHCAEANQVWCADFKGYFWTGDGQKCTPLTISDGHSRYILCCQGLRGDTGIVTVKPLFIETFRKYGLPEAIRTDNGTPFASSGLGGLTALAVWWVRLGIKLERIEPGQPQQNGRHERMHRTLKEATVNPPKENLAAQQEAFNAFCREYNQERPHEALGQRPPVVFYENSTRAYPERLPEQGGYPEDWERRRVRKAGQMKWKGKDVRLSTALWGQEVGLRPVDDGRWEIYFEDFALGLFDERTGRVVPSKRLLSKRDNDLP